MKMIKKPGGVVEYELDHWDALNYIFNTLDSYTFIDEERQEWFDIVSDALERLDKSEDEIVGLKELNHNFINQLQDNGKQLKALEIIKEKKVNTSCVISGWALEKYNSYKTHISLTQEEYDLLKEVLL